MGDARGIIRNILAEWAIEGPPRRIADDIVDTLGVAGLVIVPKEPTEAMRMAGTNYHFAHNHPGCEVNSVYRAMIKAAGGDE